MNKEDKEFLAYLYRLYRPLLVRTIVDIVKDPSCVDDCIEDTWVSLIGKCSLLRTLNEHKRTAYIRVTAQRAAIRYAKQYTVLSLDVLTENGQEPESSDVGAEDLLELRDKLDRVSDAFAMLSQHDQMILRFKYTLHLSSKEIAKTFGVSDTTARQRLSRAKRRLLQNMREAEN